MACSSLLGEKDLLRFRTKKCCRLKRKGCEFRQNRCQYSHSDFWLRRCPVYLTAISALRYVPILCPNVSLDEGCPDEAKIVNRCRDGGECPFAHSYEEVVYHPLFYKTRICDAYLRDRCESYYCPFVHGLAESREVTMFQLPFANGAQIPPHPCVIPQDKMLPDEDFTRMHKPPQITVQELCKYPTNILLLDMIDNTHSFAKIETSSDRAGWEYLLVDAIKIVTEKVSHITVPQKECFLLLNETNKLSTLLLERMRTIEAEEKLRLHSLNQTWNKRDDDTKAFSCISPTMSHSSFLMQDENIHKQRMNANNIDQSNFMVRNPQLSPFPMLSNNNGHVIKNNHHFQSHNMQFDNHNMQNTFNQIVGNSSTFVPNLNLKSAQNNMYSPITTDTSLLFNNHSLINTPHSHRNVNNNNNNAILQSSLDTLASTLEHLSHSDDLSNTLNSLPQNVPNSLPQHSSISLTQDSNKTLTQDSKKLQKHTFNTECNSLPSNHINQKKNSPKTITQNKVKGNTVTEETAHDSTACSTESSSVANGDDTSTYTSRLSMAAAR